jgi:predicted TIM-barrel fold metal-dependent hydrolase
MTIDMHHHWIGEELSAVLRTRSEMPRIYNRDDGREHLDSPIGGFPLSKGFDSVEKRIAEMDEGGVDRAVLSMINLGIENMPTEQGLPLLRVFNDSVSRICAKHPDRFSAICAVPYGDMDAAVAEFERAMALPGVVGVQVPSDGFLSAKRAERWRPLFTSANRHHAHFFVHYGRQPNDPEAPRPDWSDNRTPRQGTLDMQSRLSSNMITFVLTDFLKDFPNVTLQSHNLGGNIPLEVERLDHRYMISNPGEELPSKKFARMPIVVDCNSYGPKGIELAVSVYGADKIVFGTDGTLFGMEWSKKAIAEANIPESAKRAILHDNAARCIAPNLNKERRAAAE